MYRVTVNILPTPVSPFFYLLCHLDATISRQTREKLHVIESN